MRSYRFWSNLTEALRTGRPQNETKQTSAPMFIELYRDRAKLHQFMAAMTDIHVTNFHILAEKSGFFCTTRLTCNNNVAIPDWAVIRPSHDSTARCPDGVV